MTDTAADSFFTSVRDAARARLAWAVATYGELWTEHGATPAGPNQLSQSAFQLPPGSALRSSSSGPKNPRSIELERPSGGRFCGGTDRAEWRN
jgi:hypothetical protein